MIATVDFTRGIASAEPNTSFTMISCICAMETSASMLSFSSREISSSSARCSFYSNTGEYTFLFSIDSYRDRHLNFADGYERLPRTYRLLHRFSCDDLLEGRLPLDARGPLLGRERETTLPHSEQTSQELEVLPREDDRDRLHRERELLCRDLPPGLRTRKRWWRATIDTNQ